MDPNDQLFAQPYEVYSESVRFREKSRNGDAVVVKELRDQGLVLLVVADGVSTKPCDYLASKTTCEQVASSFVRTAGDIVDRLRSAVMEAHFKVQVQTGSCSGMLSTLAVVVWNVHENHLCYASVGDTRIYKVSPNPVDQLSVDDSDAVVIRQGGKPFVESGSVAIRMGLTRAIGQVHPLTIEVESVRFEPGESVILATDGFYSVSSFMNHIQDALASSTLQEGMSSMVQGINDQFADDASVAVLRRDDVDEEAMQKYAAAVKSPADFRDQDIAPHIMAKCAVRDMLGLIDSGRSSDLIKRLQYVERFKLKPSRQDLIGILDAIAARALRESKEGREAFDMVRRLVRVQHLSIERSAGE